MTKDFKAVMLKPAQDAEISIIDFNGKMAICADEGPILVTKEQAMKFFDLQPATTVQEPIGYLFQHEETGLTMVVDVQQVEWGFEKNNPRHQKIGPVYTTPPAAQRQWVGLTDEQISAIGSKIFPSTWNTRHVEFARAIEAKLKEKTT
jgi:hypothetical protein